MEFIDLHIHSTASDGSDTPEEIVMKALRKGLYAIAITDHDTVAGIEQAMNAAAGLPIYVIPGVELSCVYLGIEIHLLGYNIDYTDTGFVNMLNSLFELRYSRNEKICSLLREQGVNISMNLLQKKFSNKTITRNNIADFLIENGYVRDKKEAFEKYIGNKSCCFVPRTKIPVESAIKIIHSVGGTCSLAHPIQYKLSQNDYINLFSHIKKIGMDNIEGYHSDNTPEKEMFFISLANEIGLGLTGGSDYHGINKSGVELGTGRGNLMIPRTILSNIGF